MPARQAYFEKAKQLFSNLSINAELAGLLLSGDLSAGRVVAYSADVRAAARARARLRRA